VNPQTKLALRLRNGPAFSSKPVSEIMNDGHDSYFRHLLEYEPDLARWRRRVQALETPPPGSELHEDDKVFMHHSISNAARLSLASAGEHLRLAWTAIKAGELYPSAHFTTLRSALVAASQAVDVLGPDERGIRRRRGLTVIRESYENRQKFYKDSLSMPELTDSERRAIQRHLAWIDERIDRVVAAGAQKGRLDLTGQVVPYAAASVYGKGPRLEHLAQSSMETNERGCPRCRVGCNASGDTRPSPEK